MVRAFRVICLQIACSLAWGGGSWLSAAIEPISLTNLTHTYDGTPKQPGFVAPDGVVPTFSYSEASAAAPILFRRFPDELDLSYQSLGYAAHQTAGIGELLRFEEPGNRLVAEVEVILVTWAKAADYPDWAARNAGGYIHPISIDLYSASEGHSLTHIESVEEDILVPWRPLTTPDGAAYPYNGFAFRAVIRFPEPVAVPGRTMVMVSFNTQSSGFAPIREPGPYNQLNLGLNPLSTTTHGIDDDPSALLWVKHDGEDLLWGYPYTGYSFFVGPMLEVRGPRPRLPDPPVDAGNYEVLAVFELDEGTTSLTKPFTVLPAPAAIHFGATEAVVDGTPKAIVVGTEPEGLTVEVTYDGGPEPPSDPGTYRVETRVVSPNHIGLAETPYQLGYDYAAWLAATAPSMPSGDTSPDGDPDHDGWSNLWEYAFQLHPMIPDRDAAPRLIWNDDGLHYRYRRNPHALDLRLTLETSTRLSGLWESLTHGALFEVPDRVPWVAVPVMGTTDEPRRFFRLALEKHSPPSGP